MSSPTLDRRRFLQAAIGSWLVGIRLAGPGNALQTWSPADDWQPDLFLSLAADGTLTLLAHRSEMGTGIRTSLPMVLADEMDADWGRVVVRQATADRRLGSQNTDGSRSQRHFYERMRDAGAIARTMLIAAAAERWGVAPASCTTDLHQVVHPDSGKRLDYGELVNSMAGITIPKQAVRRIFKPSDRRYIGHGVPIADLDAILNGSAVYGADIRLPGMLTAMIARPPVPGAEWKSFQRDAALAVEGVRQVIEIPVPRAPWSFKPLGGIGVLAENTWAAMRGRTALEVQWDLAAYVDTSTDAQDQAMAEAARQDGRVVRTQGDCNAALAGADRVIQAEYRAPHLAHASMEPPAAVARVNDQGCEVWACTQTPQSTQRTVAQALGLKAEQVTVHVTLLGGGFGRKSKPDYSVEAALLAKQAGLPVRVIWTRPDDIQHDYYHGAAAMHLQAGLDSNGKCHALAARSSFTPIGYTFSRTHDGSDGEMGQGFLDLMFDVEHLRVENAKASPHLRIGWLRSVCNIFHAYAMGSFVDECAAAAGKDPLDYLLSLIGEDRIIDFQTLGVNYSNYGSPAELYPADTARLKAVLRKAAAMAGWGSPLPPGRGLGIAVHRSFCAYVANVVEVEVSRQGTLHIPHTWVAVDCGLAVHPDRVRAQMEGAAVFGASLARFGKITTTGGVVDQSNFHDYRIARMSEAPQQIDVAIIDREDPPAGVGEPGVPPFAPALCNAVFAATGHRIRSLPLADHDLSWS